MVILSVLSVLHRLFFTVPYNIKMGERWDFRGWCDWAYKQGNFHELIIQR